MKRILPVLALLALLPAAPAHAAATSYDDPAGDVANAKLDITKVTVKNNASKLVVRVAFPGNDKVFDFPTGNVSVFIDTDAARKGAEYGHFMEFWSDYRFAEVTHWREQPTPDWGHSPEGACVADAGIMHDKGHHLRWFKYVVKKRPGCFEADAVRIAVSTMNTGDLDPFVEYAAPYLDHVGAKHQWTDWISPS